MTKRSLALALALTATLAACGNDTAAPVAQPTPTTAVGGSTCTAGPPTTDLAVKPVASIPAGSVAPTETTFTDVVVGTGAEAKSGADVAVKYVGVLFATCAEFDSSWSRGADETFPFTVGSGVIPGFTKGVTGMLEGGRRQVVIPAADGYGEAGTAGIPGGSTLVFLIDLVSTN